MADATARDLGELALVTALCARFGPSPQVAIGPGDDAAVLHCPDGRVVATTDVLVEGVHFRRDWSGPGDVGHKAAAASLADVAAMGGTATALLVGLVAPPDLPVAWALALADGLAEEAALVGATVVGGDTVSGPGLVVSVTALGDLGGRAPVLRSGSRPGDRVVLAGATGWSAGGLALLRRGERDGPLVQAHRRPTPPYRLGPDLARAGARAMCDVSDGLVLDLGHLARASQVDVRLDLTALAPDPLLSAAAGRSGESAQDWVLTGGEDHALVATIPAGAELPPGVRVIGSVSPAASAAGGQVHVPGWQTPAVTGWEHFR